MTGEHGASKSGLTRQRWKFQVLWRAGIVTLVAAAIQFLGPRDWTAPASGVVLLAGGAGLWTLLSIRCPACRRSLGWWFLRTQSPGSWQPLTGLRECPYCKQDFGTQPARAPGSISP